MAAPELTKIRQDGVSWIAQARKPVGIVGERRPGLVGAPCPPVTESKGNGVICGSRQDPHRSFDDPARGISSKQNDVTILKSVFSGEGRGDVGGIVPDQTRERSWKFLEPGI